MAEVGSAPGDASWGRGEGEGLYSPVSLLHKIPEINDERSGVEPGVLSTGATSTHIFLQIQRRAIG